MGKRKTYRDYEQDIRTAHAEGDSKIVHARVGKWSELVPLAFLVANNEQKPYTCEELQGCEVMPMPEKKQLGFNQTGDYLCILPDYDDFMTGVFWDRKELSDFYGTIIHGQDRFYNECERACANPACDYMLIGVEGMRDKFLTFRPPNRKGGRVVRSAGASQASRAALVKHLPVRFGFKVNVLWHGGRSRAAKSLVDHNRMWLKYNFEKVLHL